MQRRAKAIHVARSIVVAAGLALTFGCTATGGTVDGRVVGIDGGRTCGAPGSVPIGHPCVCATDCAGDAIDCQTEGFIGVPGGMCADLCGSDAECTAGNLCSPLPEPIMGITGACVPRCVSNADCPPARICTTTSAGSLCFPLCQRDSDCRSGFCDEYTGACTEGPPPTEGLGHLELCTRNDECRSGRCSSTGDCYSLCSIERDGCPDGTFCHNFDPIDMGFCGPPCATNRDCDAYPSALCDRSLNPSNVGHCAHTEADVSDPCVSGNFLPAAAATAGCNGPPIGAGIPNNQFGGRCTMSPDSCEAPNFCQNGFCLQPCTSTTSVSTSTCPSGSRCWLFESGNAVCYPDCTSNTDCVSGECDPYHACVVE